jgi:hypothetical protein
MEIDKARCRPQPPSRAIIILNSYVATQSALIKSHPLSKSYERNKVHKPAAFCQYVGLLVVQYACQLIEPDALRVRHRDFGCPINSG